MRQLRCPVIAAWPAITSVPSTIRPPSGRVNSASDAHRASHISPLPRVPPVAVARSVQATAHSANTMVSRPLLSQVAKLWLPAMPSSTAACSHARHGAIDAGSDSRCSARATSHSTATPQAQVIGIAVCGGASPVTTQIA